MTVCRVCLQSMDPASEPYHPACLIEVFGQPIAPRLAVARATFPTKVGAIADKFSISGIQPKAQLGLSADGKALTIVERNGTFILKPPIERFMSVPENEHASMRIARVSGIDVAASCLLPLEDGDLAYVVRRFDRSDDVPPRKIGQVDFCQLAGKAADDKYESSAEECAKLALRYAADATATAQRLFQQFVFSDWIGNGDLHLKNLSLLERGQGYSLSPAYDLLSTWPYGDEKLALPVGGKHTKVTRKGWIDFGFTHCKLAKAEAIASIDRVLERVDESIEILANAGLPPAVASPYQQRLEQRARSLGSRAAPST